MHVSALRRISRFLLTCLSPLAAATTFRTTPVEELLQKSDIVAYVEVQSGHLLEAEGKSCGAVYKALVVAAVKGNIAKGDVIEFGPGTGREIGGKYIVFLTAGGKRLTSITSSTASLMRPAAEFRQRCASVLPDVYETLEGNGTLPVFRNFRNNFSAEVLFEEMLVTPPAGVSKRDVDVKVIAPDFYSGDSLVPLETLLERLRVLTTDPDGQPKR